MPGFLKIGCAKTSSTRRIAQWAQCHPGLALVSDTAFNLPQRIKELMHLYLGTNRYDVACIFKSCKSQWHDEWFKCSVEDVRSLVEQMEILVRVHHSTIGVRVCSQAPGRTLSSALSKIRPPVALRQTCSKRRSSGQRRLKHSWWMLCSAFPYEPDRRKIFTVIEGAQYRAHAVAHSIFSTGTILALLI